MSYFRNKIAVITGAGSGIGRALAVEMASLGCHLAISDINASSLAGTVEQLPNRDNITVHSASLDTSDREAFAVYAREVVATFGGVDVLFNNAGVASRNNLALLELDYAEYERVININLWGVIHGTHEFLPHLLARPNSHLVNVSSVFGLVAPPNTGAYCASKFAVRGYTETLRSELEGSNVQVSCVHPGVIATNIAVAADAPADMVQQFATRGLSPERAARQILKGVEKGKARVLVTRGAYLLDWLQRLTPAHYRPLMFKTLGLRQEL